MSTKSVHDQLEPTDYRHQLIVVVSGEASSQVAEHLAAEIETDYICGTRILQECNEGSNQAEILAAACRKISEQMGIAIVTLPERSFPLRQFREAMPRDVDVRFIICNGDERASTLEDEGGCRCLKVMVDEEHGGVEAVIRKIEVDVWGAGS